MFNAAFQLYILFFKPVVLVFQIIQLRTIVLLSSNSADLDIQFLNGLAKSIDLELKHVITSLELLVRLHEGKYLLLVESLP